MMRVLPWLYLVAAFVFIYLPVGALVLFSFQGGALLGSMSVIENVALPLRENTTLPDRIIRETARMKLDMVGLLHAADLLPSSLSGGMRKPRKHTGLR